jgi:hypothetical protein
MKFHRGDSLDRYSQSDQTLCTGRFGDLYVDLRRDQSNDGLRFHARVRFSSGLAADCRIQLRREKL